MAPSDPPAATALAADDFLVRLTDDDAVLDVRTPGEYAGGHLVGAHNVDVMAYDFADQVAELNLPDDRPVYLYGRSSTRPGKAAEILRGLGYDAYNVGGYDALARAGARTER